MLEEMDVIPLQRHPKFKYDIQKRSLTGQSRFYYLRSTKSLTSCGDVIVTVSMEKPTGKPQIQVLDLRSCNFTLCLGNARFNSPRVHLVFSSNTSFVK